MEQMTHYKMELLKRGRKIKQLADALQMDYEVVVKILAGYKNIPDGFEMAVIRVLNLWDEQDQQTRTIDQRGA